MRSGLRLVWALDVRHLTAHRTRLLLSALGIAVGVSLAVAVGSISSSISGSLHSIAQAAASKANIEIRPNGRGELSNSVLTRVRAVPGVQHAGVTVESYVQLRAHGRSLRTLLLGIDSEMMAMAPRSVSPSQVRVADPFGLWLPGNVADALGVKAGEHIDVTTPGGWRSMPVGIVLPPAAAERSRVVLATVGVAQPLLGRGNGYDAIYVEASDAATALPTVQRAVGALGRAGPVAFSGTQLQRLLAGANASFAVGSIVALFVGAFLVYNTMSMAAVERVREAALLRAVGARRRQVFALFCAEGGLLGLIGASLGVVGGVLLSGRLLAMQGGQLEAIFPIQITKLTVSPRVLVASGVAGVVASLAAAYLPARRISRADPAPSLGAAGAFEDPTRGPRRASTVIGMACAAIGPVLAVTTLGAGQATSPLTLGGFAITLTGIALLIPTVVPWIARISLGWVGRRTRTPGVVRLAVGEVLRSPGRTAYTVGAVLLSLAIVVGFSAGQSSFLRAFDLNFKTILSMDLYARSPTWRPFGSDVPLDESLAQKIDAIPGVQAAYPFRLMPATLENTSIIVLAFGLDTYARNARLGRADRARQLAAAKAASAPGTILASPSMRTQLGHGVGDTITLATPTGVHTLRITGLVDDPSAVNPEIVFDFAEFKRVWGVGGSDNFGIRVRDGYDMRQVQRSITRTLGPRYGLQVDTRDEYRKLVSSVVRSITGLIGAVQLVAVIVAALGLANTLLISTFERRRDLGVLRAVGMLRKQLRRMVAAEALMIGSLGVVGAWGLGTFMGLGIYLLVQSQLGVPLRFSPPPAVYLGSAVLGLVSSLVASLYPAHRAAHLDVVEALQYE